MEGTIYIAQSSRKLNWTNILCGSGQTNVSGNLPVRHDEKLPLSIMTVVTLIWFSEQYCFSPWSFYS